MRRFLPQESPPSRATTWARKRMSSTAPRTGECGPITPSPSTLFGYRLEILTNHFSKSRKGIGKLTRSGSFINKNERNFRFAEAILGAFLGRSETHLHPRPQDVAIEL